MGMKASKKALYTTSLVENVKKRIQISKINTYFIILKLCFSPKRVGSVSFPVILSPWMARISKKAVRAKTSPVANKKTTATDIILLLFANAGKIQVTVPHARTIKIVFEPGISLIRTICFLGDITGMIFKLYDNPKRLMTRSKIKDERPVIKLKYKPEEPDNIARIHKYILFSS